MNHFRAESKNVVDNFFYSCLIKYMLLVLEPSIAYAHKSFRLVDIFVKQSTT